MIASFRRAVCPAYEGIETITHFLAECEPYFFSRAVCPAYEGIETASPALHAQTSLRARAVCPAYEGIETDVDPVAGGATPTWPRGLPRL